MHECLKKDGIIKQQEQELRHLRAERSKSHQRPPEAPSQGLAPRDTVHGEKASPQSKGESRPRSASLMRAGRSAACAITSGGNAAVRQVSVDRKTGVRRERTITEVLAA